jgi:hypothetical protein
MAQSVTVCGERAAYGGCSVEQQPQRPECGASLDCESSLGSYGSLFPHQLNALEHAHDASKSSKEKDGTVTEWYDIRGVSSDDDESDGDHPRHIVGAYWSELPVGDLWFCSDGGLAFYSHSLVDDTILFYPPSRPRRDEQAEGSPSVISEGPLAAVGEREGDRRGYRARMMCLYLWWTLNLVTGAHDNDDKRTAAARNSVPFFGVSVHSEGARQNVQYLSMPPTKKVKMLTRVLEFCWALGVDMVALMERHVRVDEGAREAVAMCLDSDSLLGMEVQKLVSRREAMSLAGYVHHVASIVSFIARCTRQLYCDIYRETLGKEGMPSQEVDYDGEFRLSRSTLGELALMIYLMHQPGGHRCLRRIKKIIYFSFSLSPIQTGFWIRGGSRAFARISSRTLGRYVVVTNPAPPRRPSNGFHRLSGAHKTTPAEPRQPNGPLAAPHRRPDPPQPAPHPPRLVCGGNHGAGTHWLVPILGGCDSHTIANTDGVMV